MVARRITLSNFPTIVRCTFLSLSPLPASVIESMWLNVDSDSETVVRFGQLVYYRKLSFSNPLPAEKQTLISFHSLLTVREFGCHFKNLTLTKC